MNKNLKAWLSATNFLEETERSQEEESSSREEQLKQLDEEIWMVEQLLEQTKQKLESLLSKREDLLSPIEGRPEVGKAQEEKRTSYTEAVQEALALLEATGWDRPETTSRWELRKVGRYSLALFSPVSGSEWTFHGPFYIPISWLDLSPEELKGKWEWS